MKACLGVFALAVVVICVSCDMTQTRAPQEPTDSYAKAQGFLSAGDYQSAAALLADFVAERPGDSRASDAWLLLGDCRMQLKDYPGAESAYTQAAAKPKSAAMRARAEVGMGQAFEAQGKYPQAIGAWESVLKTGEYYVDAPAMLLTLGRTYLVEGNWLMGRDRLERIVKRYPASSEANDAKDLLSQPGDVYSVQVASFVTLDEAGAFVELLKKEGVRDIRIRERKGAVEPFSVRCGKFVNRLAAIEQAAKLHTLSPSATVFP